MRHILDSLMLLTDVSKTSIGAIENLWAFIDGIAEFIGQAKATTTRLRILWFLATTILLIFCALMIFVPLLFGASYKIGMGISVVVLGMFFGFTALNFVPPKIMTAWFGALVGMSSSEFGDGAGIISAIRDAIAGMASEISNTVNPGTEQVDPFITAMVWTFAGITMFTSFPAFFMASPEASVLGKDESDEEGEKATVA